MKTRTIPLRAHEVRAILDGRQTQLRRVIKPQPITVNQSAVYYPGKKKGDVFHGPDPLGGMSFQLVGDPGCYRMMSGDVYAEDFGPYGQPGDQLWGQEKFSHHLFREGCWYWADGNESLFDATIPLSSTQMPRECSRITLEVKAVRVERVQEISADDAELEGIDCCDYEHPHTGEVLQAYSCEGGNIVADDPCSAFELLWDSVAKPGEKWADDPFVWVVEFERVDQ